jgi:hyaluronan synthase
MVVRVNGLLIWGAVFVFFYLAVLVWQTYYAIATARNTTWGTRPSTHEAEDELDAPEPEAARHWSTA